MTITLQRWSPGRALLAIALMLPMSVCLPASGPEEAAESAALTWLAAVDAGDYAASWNTASTFFKEHISETNWAATAAGVRGSLGALKSREFVSAKIMHSLPGAPDGDYVVIQYKASYAAKADAIETVTPMKDVDGAWHVTGYFMK